MVRQRPREWNNPDAKKHLAEVRALVLEKEDYVGRRSRLQADAGSL